MGCGRSEPCLSESVPESLPSARATFSCATWAGYSASELPFSPGPLSLSGVTCLVSTPSLAMFHLSLPPDVSTTAMMSTAPGPAPGL